MRIFMGPSSKVPGDVLDNFDDSGAVLLLSLQLLDRLDSFLQSFQDALALVGPLLEQLAALAILESLGYVISLLATFFALFPDYLGCLLTGGNDILEIGLAVCKLLDQVVQVLFGVVDVAQEFGLGELAGPGS